MKHSLLIFMCALEIIACRKSNSPDAGNNGSRLTAISSDSAGAWQFVYTGNLITDLAPDTAISRYGTNANIQYLNTDTIQYVTVDFYDVNNYKIIYALASSKLPLHIDESYFVNGVQYHSNIAEFIYLPGTDLLDSVIVNTNVNAPIIFKFTYTGKNITSVVETQVYNNNSYLLSTFNYTYDNKPNVFRNTDSLLYIYTYPMTALRAQSMVVAAFFAETFSASKFNNISTDGITNGAWNQNLFGSKMTYTKNAAGKITEEIFTDEVFEGLAGKKFYY